MVCLPWHTSCAAASLCWRQCIGSQVLWLCARAGAILLGSGVEGGYCVYGLASFLYYAIYPPVRGRPDLLCRHEDNHVVLNMLPSVQMFSAAA